MKITKYAVLALCLVGGVIQSSSFAQEEDEIPAGGNYEKADVFLTSGDTLSTYVYYNNCYPQLYQSKLLTIDEETYKRYQDGEKIKKDITRFSVFEVEGYIMSSGREFRRVTYANLLSDKKEEKISKDYLLEVLVSGEITVYRKGYRTRNGFIRKPVSKASSKGGETFINFMENNFELVVQKGSTIKNIRNYNLKKLVGDKPEVLQNFAKGTYGFKSEFTKQASFGANCDTPYKDGLLKMVTDYNSKPAAPPEESGKKKKKKKKEKKKKKKKKNKS